MTQQIDVNHRDRAGRTPLHYAVADGPRDIKNPGLIKDPAQAEEARRKITAFKLENTKRLLDAGADVNARDQDGRTPLHSAAQTAEVEVIKLLLDAGAEIDAENTKGETPLYISTKAIWSSPDVIRLLRERGADPFHPAANGMTVVKWAQGLNDDSEIKAAYVDLLNS